MAAKVRLINDAWWIVIHDRGRRRRKRIGPSKANKRQAEALAERLNAQIVLGIDSASSSENEMPCSRELNDWHAAYSPTFKAGYSALARAMIDNHLEPFFGEMDLSQIRETDLLNFIKAKSNQGLKPATIKNSLSLLRRVCSLAVRERRLSHNPATGIGGLIRRVTAASAEETTEAQFWTRHEVGQLLEVTGEHEPRFLPMLSLLFATGVRRGEAIGLKWADINLQGRKIAIRRSVTTHGISTPKTGKSRQVSISPKAAADLEKLFQQRRRESMEQGWSEPSEWVFPSTTGGPLHPRNVERTWQRVRRRAQAKGVRALRLHCTRHTWATYALQSNKPVPWVSDQLGHADPALTLRIYAHAIPQQAEDLSFADFGVPERPYAAPGNLAVGPQRRKSAKKVVTRARFERATPSFGGFDANSTNYCFREGIRSQWARHTLHSGA